MIAIEKATYKRNSLMNGIEKLKAVNITAARKNAHYAILSELKSINEWLQDNAGNTTYFYKPYYLEEYKSRVYNLYSSTKKSDLDNLARLAKKEMIGMINSIFADGEAGELNII